MSKKRKPYDMDSPGTQALADEIVHGTFMKEGTMVAFPMCFPGASAPIAADESRITALDTTPDGIVYGGTSGRLSHVFVGMFHGVTGMVFDLGTIPGADHCTAVCCGREHFVACANGPAANRIVSGKLQPLPFDLIQEWGFRRSPFQELGEVAGGEPIIHAVSDVSREYVVGITANHLFCVDIRNAGVEVVCEIGGSGRIAVGSRGGVWGLNGTSHLWRYDPPSRTIEHHAVKLPPGAWDRISLTWAQDSLSRLLYTVDGAGDLFSFSEEQGFNGPLARTPLCPVGPMAVTHDRRVFGFCGEEVAKMFCFDPVRGELTDLGAAVSVLERRRYGYVFGDAVTGRDGQIIFGEDDDLGHLWLYFPKIQTR